MADLITFKSKVISKLSRFKNKIYRKELGVILSYSLEDFNEDSFYLYDKKRYNKQVTFKKSDDMKEILSFFEKMGKYSISFNTVEKWLSEGSDCWLIYYNDIVIGGTWVLKGEVTITQLTEHWLSKNKKVIFDRDSVYRGYTIIDDNYRGQGIYQSFNHCLLKHYYDKESINKIILITRASNASVISTTMKNNGKLIGIVEVRNILGWIYRKEFFINRKEKRWS